MLPALGKCCKHQGLVLIIQWPMGDLGAQDSFIFGWIVERVRREEGREKVGLCLLRAEIFEFLICSSRQRSSEMWGEGRGLHMFM